MIIDPDFLDHWRTRMLVNLLSDEMAPLYLIRIWSHCQNRKQTQFKPMPNQGLKALCRYPGDADKLMSAMVDSGFVKKIGSNTIEAVGWGDHNAQLVKAWANGSKGGRPSKKPDGNRMETPVKPDGKRSEKIRDQIREEKNTSDWSDSSVNQGSTSIAKTKLASELPDQIYFESTEIEFMASQAFERAGYHGNDGSIFWKMAALSLVGQISEHEFNDSLAATKAKGKNKPGYARVCLRDLLAKRGIPIDSDALLDCVKIKPECPTSAPKLQEAQP
jgi:hypothetical protein